MNWLKKLWRKLSSESKDDSPAIPSTGGATRPEREPDGREWWAELKKNANVYYGLPDGRDRAFGGRLLQEMGEVERGK